MSFIFIENFAISIFLELSKISLCQIFGNFRKLASLVVIAKQLRNNWLEKQWKHTKTLTTKGDIQAKVDSRSSSLHFILFKIFIRKIHLTCTKLQMHAS